MNGPSVTTGTGFTLAEWRVEPSRNLLRNGRRQVSLQPLQMDLLCRLARDPGQVVARETLINDVWPRRGVADDVLSRSIAEIRTALGDDARSPRFIETVPRRGYRLLVRPLPFNRRGQLALVGVAALVVAVAVWFSARDTGSRPGIGPVSLLDDRQITALPGSERSVSLDAAGRQLAFVSAHDGNRRILLADARGRSARVVVEHPGLDGPSLSPDGRWLAYLRRPPGSCELLIHEPGTGQERLLGQCWRLSASSTTFTNDSQFVAHTVPAELGNGIGLAPVAGGSVQVLTRPPEARSDRRPRFSPDGQWLSFSRGDEVTRELFVVSAFGGEPRQLTQDLQLAEDHTWLDPSTLVFASDRLARQGLWSLHLDTGRINTLGVLGAYGPFHHQGLLYYEHTVYEANLWRIDMTQPDEPPVRAIQSSRYDNHPVFTSDGSTLMFVSNRSGLSALWRADPDGNEPHLVYEVKDARVSRPAAGPGRRALVSVFDPQGSHLREIHLDSRTVRPLPESGHAASAGVYSRDGEQIFYIDERDGQPRLCQMTVTNGHTAPVGDLRATRIQAGPEGRVYFTQPKTDGIFFTHPFTGQASRVVDDFPAWRRYAWTIAGTGLYFQSDRGIDRIDLIDGARRLVAPYHPTAIGVSIGVNGDETLLYISRTDDARIDIHSVPIEPAG